MSFSQSFVAVAEQVRLEPVLEHCQRRSSEANVTSLGRPFHTFTLATGKARSPTVDRGQAGTSSRSVEADLSLRPCSMSATHVNDDTKYSGAEPWSVQHRYLECNSLWHAEPMETDERISDVVATSPVEDESCCSILD